MWKQWDWGQGPMINGRATNLFGAWFGWSRFRVVIPTWDRTLPTVVGCLDRAMRAFGGAPTCWLLVPKTRSALPCVPRGVAGRSLARSCLPALPPL